MDFELVWSGRLDTLTGGGGIPYYTKPRSGGGQCKRSQVMVKAVAGSTGPITLNVDIEHGPDGVVFVTHTSNAINTTIATPPSVLAGDSTETVVLGEWVRFMVKISGGATQWAYVEVYEMRKPC